MAKIGSVGYYSSILTYYGIKMFKHSSIIEDICFILIGNLFNLNYKHVP
jgi:hypothetical protein